MGLATPGRHAYRSGGDHSPERLSIYARTERDSFLSRIRRRIGGQIVGQQDVSFDTLKVQVRDLVSIVKQDPGIDDVTAFAGGRGNVNSGFMFMSLKPDEQRRKTGDTVDAIMDRLRPKIGTIPGVTLFLQAFQDLQIGGRNTATQYQYSLTTDSLKDLNTWAPKLKDAMDKLPQIKDVATDQQDQGLRAQLVIDRDTASRLGVSPLTLDETLSDAFSQAPGVNDLYAVEPIPRGHGGSAPVPNRPGRAEEYLCEEHHGSNGPTVRDHPL